MTAILENSSPEILKPIPFYHGTFQVIWIEQIQEHGLFHKTNEGLTVLATHDNGFSCHALAERIIAKEWVKALAQISFIRDCGGMATTEKCLEQFKKVTMADPFFN